MPQTTDPQTHMLMSFILLLLIAGFTSYYASRKGRNPFIWFVIGTLLGIFAPLILMFLPTIKSEADRVEGEPTMLVSRPDPSLHQEQVPPPPPTPEELKRQQEENKLWYYLDQNHQQEGPVSIVALRELWNTGRLELTSYVWADGMSQWEKVENLPDLKSALNKK